MNQSRNNYNKVMDDLLFAYTSPKDNGITVEWGEEFCEERIVRVNDERVKNRLQGLFISNSLIYSYILNYNNQPLHSSYFAQPDFWRGGWDEGDINYDLIKWIC